MSAPPADRWLRRVSRSRSRSAASLLSASAALSSISLASAVARCSSVGIPIDRAASNDVVEQALRSTRAVAPALADEEPRVPEPAVGEPRRRAGRTVELDRAHVMAFGVAGAARGLRRARRGNGRPSRSRRSCARRRRTCSGTARARRRRPSPQNRSPTNVTASARYVSAARYNDVARYSHQARRDEGAQLGHAPPRPSRARRRPRRVPGRHAACCRSRRATASTTGRISSSRPCSRRSENICTP